jgi:hypothetical protein
MKVAQDKRGAVLGQRQRKDPPTRRDGMKSASKSFSFESDID